MRTSSGVSSGRATCCWPNDMPVSSASIARLIVSNTTVSWPSKIGRASCRERSVRVDLGGRRIIKKKKTQYRLIHEDTYNQAKKKKLVKRTITNRQMKND